MANFEEFKKKATETANVVMDKSAVYAKAAVEKAKILGKIAKLTAELVQDKDNLKKDYTKVGQLYYAQSQGEAEGELADVMNNITVANAAIDAKNAEIEALKAMLNAPVEEPTREATPAEEPAAEESENIIDVDESELTPVVEETIEEVKEAVEEAKEAVAEAVEEVKEAAEE